MAVNTFCAESPGTALDTVHSGGPTAVCRRTQGVPQPSAGALRGTDNRRDVSRGADVAAVDTGRRGRAHGCALGRGVAQTVGMLVPASYASKPRADPSWAGGSWGQSAWGRMQGRTMTDTVTPSRQLSPASTWWTFGESSRSTVLLRGPTHPSWLHCVQNNFPTSRDPKSRKSEPLQKKTCTSPVAGQQWSGG